MVTDACEVATERLGAIVWLLKFCCIPAKHQVLSDLPKHMEILSTCGTRCKLPGKLSLIFCKHRAKLPGFIAAGTRKAMGGK